MSLNIKQSKTAKRNSIGLIISLTFILSACTTSTQWIHPKKSLTDFRIDEKTCHATALQKAQDASLVAQPLATIYQINFSNCMHAMGWSTNQDSSPVTTVKLQPNQGETTLELSAEDDVMFLPGTFTILKQNNQGIVLRGEDDTYANLMFQKSSGIFINIAPPLNSKAVLFDSAASEHSRSSFFYQYENDKLIFACTSYIFFGNNKRLLITFSHDMGTAPKNFMELPQEKFAELTTYQDQWQSTISTMAGDREQ